MTSVRNRAHGLENDTKISLDGRISSDHTGLSFHELAVRICIDALVCGSPVQFPLQQFPERLSLGNTLVLTLGDTPVWISRPDATLPHELFGSTPQDISSAIFARHVTHQQCLYHLLATRIAWIGATELNLHSVSSTEASHDDIAFERLSILANELRAVAPLIVEHSEPLRRQVTSDQPVLLVTCDSGTVVMANTPFTQVWETANQPVGLRFTELMKFPPFSIGSKWTTRISQLAGNTCPVTVVTFVSREKLKEDESKPADFLIHSLRNQLSGIVTAASYLSQHAQSLDHDEREMIQIIESSAIQLGRSLARLDVLTVPSHRKDETTEIASALQAVADSVVSDCGSAQITISDSAAGRIGHSFRDVSALCEAILLSHGHHESEQLSTVVEGSTHNGRLTVVFRTTGIPETRIHNSRCWRTYADSISERIGASIKHESRNGGSIHITHLESNILTQ